MSGDGDKLGLHATWSMAVGGMVGGGIFSTLGAALDHRNSKGIPDRAIIGLGALSATLATIALVVRLARESPWSLAALAVLVLAATLGRPWLLRHLKRADEDSHGGDLREG